MTTGNRSMRIPVRMVAKANPDAIAMFRDFKSDNQSHMIAAAIMCDWLSDLKSRNIAMASGFAFATILTGIRMERLPVVISGVTVVLGKRVSFSMPGVATLIRPD